MVRAILAGRKTQMRRIVMPQSSKGRIIAEMQSPFEVGDRLLVKEGMHFDYVVRPYYSADNAEFRYKLSGFSPEMMPKWASRITLEITCLWLERIQEISEAEAIKEGFNANKHTPISRFREAWKTLNGAKSWDNNPWVWVYEFRRVEDEKK